MCSKWTKRKERPEQQQHENAFSFISTQYKNLEETEISFFQNLIPPTSFDLVLSINVFFCLEKLKFSPRPVDKKLELGSVKKVYCKAQGADPPTIKWMKVRK